MHLPYRQVQKIHPDYPSLSTEFNRLKTAKAAYAARDKEIAKNMAKNLFGDTKKIVKNDVDKERGSGSGVVVGDDKNSSSGSKDSVAFKGNAVTDSTVKKEVAGTNDAEAEVLSSNTITGISSSGQIHGAGEVVLEKQSKREIDSTDLSSTSTSSSSSSFFTMIACSAAVLIVSLFIAYYLK